MLYEVITQNTIYFMTAKRFPETIAYRFVIQGFLNLFGNIKSSEYKARDMGHEPFGFPNKL